MIAPTAVAAPTAADGTLTYTPAPNTSGTATIALQIEDDGGTANGGVNVSTTQQFTITVNAVNDAPGFTAVADQTVNEDAGPQTVAGWATGMSAGPNEETQTVSFVVTGNTNAALFSAGPTVAPNGTLTYTPAPNAAGTATITLQIQDNGGTANGGVNVSATQQFAIAVTQLLDEMQTFTFDNIPATYVVPAGVTAIRIEAAGAQGGWYTLVPLEGGRGGSVVATVGVTPGTSLTVLVGGAGEIVSGGTGGIGGFNGGRGWRFRQHVRRRGWQRR